jgi:hypothetical protein
VSDAQLQCFIERLRSYHGAVKVRIELFFDDGQSVYQEAVSE